MAPRPRNCALALSGAQIATAPGGFRIARVGQDPACGKLPPSCCKLLRRLIPSARLHAMHERSDAREFASEGSASPPRGHGPADTHPACNPSRAGSCTPCGKKFALFAPELGNLPRSRGPDRAVCTVFRSGWPGAIPIQIWPAEELPRVRASERSSRVNMGTAFAEVAGA